MSTLTTKVFKQYLVQYWDQTPVTQEYVVHSKREQKRLGTIFQANSLKECFEKYSWNGKDYHQNSEVLARLSERIRYALKVSNDRDVKTIAEEIYKWGGVPLKKKGGKPNNSALWLEKYAATDNLVSKILESIDVLESGENLNKFDGKDLIMNSGFTKVASLASNEESLIIMDGRVGAALGDLALVAMNDGGHSDIDAEIIFPWGGKKMSRREIRGKESRNPSTTLIKFPRLFGSNLDSKHASAMHIVSKLVRTVVGDLKSKYPDITARQFECALFMWGYDIISRRKMHNFNSEIN